MRRTLKTVIFLLIFTLLFSSATLAKSENAKSSLVALGDSIPYGYNLGVSNSSPSKLAFPNLIGEEADLRVRNLAVPGWKTGDMLHALQTDQKYRQAVKHADYITLNIGSNDLLHALQNAVELSKEAPQSFPIVLAQQIEESQLYSNLASIIGELRSQTKAPIVVYNIYNPFRVDDLIYFELYPIGLQVLPVVNNNISNIISNFKMVSIADAYHVFGNGNSGSNVILSDIHPSTEGHIKLAKIGLDGLGLK